MSSTLPRPFADAPAVFEAGPVEVVGVGLAVPGVGDAAAVGPVVGGGLTTGPVGSVGAAAATPGSRPSDTAVNTTNAATAVPKR
ncbi:hypothetical protein GCM10023195_82330 [Actinoallomurus liliacearum]|uniref:Uncharacterized protein n=1 Tax=Actinoallomurus liliacearum TaxID=1080073 RepID=A0ABP8TZ54_9ACTN